MTDIVHVENLVKRYDDLIALDHFNLSIAPGEIFGLLGPNGSGKTTSINCILQLLAYDKGTIELFGEPMTPARYDLKRRIVDNMLAKVPAHGKAVFVDYHGPAAWQPIGWLLKYVNRWLEPFAEALWRHEISEYATHADEFVWNKRTIFGGVYQIVIVTRKPAA